jgi:hypothetical protein
VNGPRVDGAPISPNVQGGAVASNPPNIATPTTQLSASDESETMAQVEDEASGEGQEDEGSDERNGGSRIGDSHEGSAMNSVEDPTTAGPDTDLD